MSNVAVSTEEFTNFQSQNGNVKQCTNDSTNNGLEMFNTLTLEL